MSILASGSSGNCTLLETSQTRLLVDAGLGKKETLRRLAAVERSVDRLDGIVISHEHSDHIGGLDLCWRSGAPRCISPRKRMPRRCTSSPSRTPSGSSASSSSRRASALPWAISKSPRSAIPHDAVDPLGFTFRAGGVKVAIATDLGYMTELAKHHLRDSDAMILESNHDLEMLKVGPYPWHVKQRVMSRTGHLSNDTVSQFLADPEGFDARSRYLVLAHLSEANNNPDVARICAEEALGRRARRLRLPRRIASSLAARASCRRSSCKPVAGKWTNDEMTARIIIGVVALASAAGCGMWVTFVNFEIIRMVNDQLPKEEQFATLDWHFFKYQKLRRDYVALYPDGHLLRRRRILTVLMAVCVLIAAWSLVPLQIPT